MDGRETNRAVIAALSTGCPFMNELGTGTSAVFGSRACAAAKVSKAVISATGVAITCTPKDGAVDLKKSSQLKPLAGHRGFQIDADTGVVHLKPSQVISGASSEFFGHHNHAGFSIDNFRTGSGVYFPGEE
jgi:hypothetical protein